MKVVTFDRGADIGEPHPSWLNTIECSARTYGNDFHVVGRVNPPMATKFMEVYPPQHASGMAVDETMDYFCRWFRLRQWMRDTHTPVVFRIDPDMLVFENMQRVWEDVGRPSWTNPHACFVTLPAIVDICDYILDSYQKGVGMARGFYTYGNGVDDVWFLDMFRYGERVDLGLTQASENRSGLVDTNIWHAQGHPLFEDRKDIWFVQGQPLWVRNDGCRKLFTLHLYGPELNTKLEQAWDQSRKSVGGTPVRLTLRH